MSAPSIEHARGLLDLARRYAPMDPALAAERAEAAARELREVAGLHAAGRAGGPEPVKEAIRRVMSRMAGRVEDD